MKLTILCTLSLLASSVLGAETFAGKVSDAEGSPIEDAVARVSGTDKEARSDAEGRFELAAETPLVLEVTHPSFAPSRFVIRTAPVGQVELVMRPRHSVVSDEIAVSASRSQENFSPQSTAASILTTESSVASLSGVGDLVAQAPGVSQNGQGGLFQTYSIRGVSRQRVLTLVEGIRIVGERRAGVSASFFDPLLLGSVEVVRGPSSTYWGSGALGGVVQLFGRRFSGPSVAAGATSQGSESFARFGYGRQSDGGGWSWGVASREAGRSKTPSGLSLLSGYEQHAATFIREWSTPRTTYELLLLGSRGEDIGKSSTDFPDRLTTYPLETHGLMRLSASRSGGWRIEAYAHPNQLETRVETPGRERSEVDNRAFDWGFDLQRERVVSGRSTVRWGADFFARQDVRAREETFDSSGPLRRAEETISNASEHEIGVYGAIEAGLGGRGRDPLALSGAPEAARRAVTVLAGGRIAYQRQDNASARRTEDSAVTAFVGIVAPLTRRYELTGNLGTGLRFPSISERYFSGTTGRGLVGGNPDLEPESSISADIGLRWTGNRVFLVGSVFRSDIEDYIERVAAAPDRLTFVNLSSGRIEGIELEGAWQAAARWSFSFGGHAMAGNQSSGQPLADIPSDRFHAGWSFEGGTSSRQWSWRGRWERRLAKNDPAGGEKAIPAADLVSSALAWQLRPDLALTLSASNLLDREYFNSADEKVAPSPGRSISLAIEWEPGGSRSW